MFYDEFGFSRAAQTHYAWSQRNHRPCIPSDESHKGERLNGFLAVNAKTGETFLDFQERNNSLTVAKYFVVLCLVLMGCGYKTIRVIMDNCPSHHEKMGTHFNKLLNYVLRKLGATGVPNIQFIYTPTYSPQLNLAEYFIHHIRQSCLYHTPPTMTVRQKADRILAKLKQRPIQTPQQTQNTLRYIYKQARL